MLYYTLSTFSCKRITLKKRTIVHILSCVSSLLFLMTRALHAAAPAGASARARTLALFSVIYPARYYCSRYRHNSSEYKDGWPVHGFHLSFALTNRFNIKLVRVVLVFSKEQVDKRNEYNSRCYSAYNITFPDEPCAKLEHH